jgi:hypothetical protein
MDEFDPEAYLDSKLDPRAEQQSGQNGKEREGDDRDRSDRKKDSRRDRSRSRDRRRSRSKDRRRSRDRRSRSKDRRDDRNRDRDSSRRDERRYDDGYKYGSSSRPVEEPPGLKQLSSSAKLVASTDEFFMSAPKSEEDGFERDLRTVFVAQVPVL